VQRPTVVLDGDLALPMDDSPDSHEVSVAYGRG
jgi:hypothetical protein